MGTCSSGSCAEQHKSKAVQKLIKFGEVLVWRMPSHSFLFPNKPLIRRASLVLHYTTQSTGLTTSLTGNKNLVYMVVIFTTKNVLKKTKLPYNPVIPLLSIYLKKRKTLIHKDTWNPVFITALFTIAKMWKQTKSINRWMDREDVVYNTYTHTHTHTMEYYSAIKKKEILPFATK